MRNLPGDGGRSFTEVNGKRMIDNALNWYKEKTVCFNMRVLEQVSQRGSILASNWTSPKQPTLNSVLLTE